MKRLEQTGTYTLARNGDAVNDGLMTFFWCASQERITLFVAQARRLALGLRQFASEIRPIATPTSFVEAIRRRIVRKVRIEADFVESRSEISTFLASCRRIFWDWPCSVV